MSTIKKKDKINNKYIIIIAIIFIIMIINIVLIIKLIAPKISTSNNNTQSMKSSEEKKSQKEPELTEEEEIKTLPEYSRMKRYIGIFFDNIEEGNYDDAYNVLNNDFKNTYFPKLEDFITYADTYFNPSTIAITYDNIERLANNKTGNMYIIWLTIGQIFQSKLNDDEKLEQTNFVIIERDYNNYEMSFSVNNAE